MDSFGFIDAFDTQSTGHSLAIAIRRVRNGSIQEYSNTASGRLATGTQRHFNGRDGSGPKAALPLGVSRHKGIDVPAEVATGMPALPCRSQAYPG
ncbi:MAG: hypothetical protein OXU79_05355 [Gemmatimonadota bacterium]|nr:hypothetical protein [Gemmatimonadota bacterium]